MATNITPVRTFDSATPVGRRTVAVRLLRPGYVSSRESVRNPGPDLMVEFWDTTLARDDSPLGRFVYRCPVPELPGPGNTLVLAANNPALTIDAATLDAIRTWLETEF